MDEELLTFRSRVVSLVAVFVCETYTELFAGEWVNFVSKGTGILHRRRRVTVTWQMPLV